MAKCMIIKQFRKKTVMTETCLHYFSISGPKKLLISLSLKRTNLITIIRSLMQDGKMAQFLKEE